jgi:predicted small secreted protein
LRDQGIFMKKATILAALALLGGLSACNTVKGVGQDIEAAGRGIGNAADDVKDDMERPD